MKVVAINRVLCNDGTYDITNGAVAPCDSAGGVKGNSNLPTKGKEVSTPAPPKNMTSIHIGLFVGGVVVGYLLSKYMKK
jgi:hypothetical protein